DKPLDDSGSCHVDGQYCRSCKQKAQTFARKKNLRRTPPHPKMNQDKGLDKNRVQARTPEESAMIPNNQGRASDSDTYEHPLQVLSQKEALIPGFLDTARAKGKAIVPMASSTLHVVTEESEILQQVSDSPIFSENTTHPKHRYSPKSSAKTTQVKQGKTSKPSAKASNLKQKKIFKTKARNMSKSLAKTTHPKQGTTHKPTENSSHHKKTSMPKSSENTIQSKEGDISKSSEDTVLPNESNVPKLSQVTILFKGNDIPKSSQDTNLSKDGKIYKPLKTSIWSKESNIPKSSQDTIQSKDVKIHQPLHDNSSSKESDIPKSSQDTIHIWSKEINTPRSSQDTIQFKDVKIHMPLKDSVLFKATDTPRSSLDSILSKDVTIHKPLKDSVLCKATDSPRSSLDSIQPKDYKSSKYTTQSNTREVTKPPEATKSQGGHIIKSSKDTKESQISHHLEEQVELPEEDMVRVIIDKEEFEEVLREAGEKLVAVDFSASWCGPCKTIKPHFHSLSLKHEDVLFLEVDADDCEQLVQDCDVFSLPTFQFYKKEEKVGEFSGALLEKLEASIEELK
ncbi:thioredoxin domain-containing protein 2, partial [Cricetulus griseus]